MEEKLRIPLSKVYIDQEIREAVLDALDSGWYILGERVREFEKKFADFCGVKNAVCTSSGTAALFLSLLALNIGPGDEVIVPSFSFIATASPILHVGARPVLVDINPRTYTLDPEMVRKRISSHTKALIPVHLYGHPADLDPLMDIAEKKDLFLIEDACQAHGAEYKKRKVGGIGHIGFFSFYPSKNMTVCGDGGVVTTNDDRIAEKIRVLRNHGRQEKYVHRVIGYNLRFNEIQAAIGSKQLERLPSWNNARRRIARIYSNFLSNVVITPIEERWAKHVYHMYVIRTERRDNLREFLKNYGISSGIHYPVPIHKQPSISKTLTSQAALRNSEKCAETVLSIPMYPKLPVSEAEYICERIIEFFR